MNTMGSEKMFFTTTTNATNTNPGKHNDPH